MSKTKVQRNYKDTIFRMLFKDRENLMSLYNALNRTNYVDQVRIYARQMPLGEAVEKAVDYCIESDILSDFLKKNRAEAIAMSIYEYDEKLHFETLLEEGRVQGREQGVNLLNRLNSILIDTDRLDDLKRATKDKAYRELLMKELLPEELSFGS